MMNNSILEGINFLIDMADKAVINSDWVLSEKERENLSVSMPIMDIKSSIELFYYCKANAIPIMPSMMIPIVSIVRQVKAKKEKEKLQQQLKLEYQRLSMKQDAIIKALQKENEQLKSGKKQNNDRLESLTCLNESLNRLMKAIREYCQ